MSFDDTRWSIVLRAGTAAEGSREAMASLCQTYWPSLYSFLRARGYSKEDASDLLQGFFLALLEKDWVSRARPEAGRFRTFLLTALVRFVSNDAARQHTQKRGGNVAFVRFDADGAEELHQKIPSNAHSPESLFERQWAHGILQRAMDQLSETYRSTGKLALFEQLSPLMATAATDSCSADAAQNLGMTPGAVRVAVHRMRQRYRKAIFTIVSETVAHPEDVDEEIRHLIEALSRRDGNSA